MTCQNSPQKDDKGSEQRKVTVVDLFRPTLIMKRSFNMFYQVISVSVISYPNDILHYYQN